MPLNVRVGRGELPLLAVLAARAVAGRVRRRARSTTAARAGSASAGWRSAWCSTSYYRTVRGQAGLQARHRAGEGAHAAARRRPSTARSSCPCSGTPLDDDIMQTAGRLAAEENEDLGEGGAVIEALWVFEVPMALPLDARVPEDELKRARAGARARQGGGGGVRGRRGRHRDRARAPRRRGDRARGAPPRRGGDRAGGRGADSTCAAGRCSAARPGCATRSWARRPATCVNKAPLPGDPHRAAAAGARRGDARRTSRPRRPPGDPGPSRATTPPWPAR